MKAMVLAAGLGTRLRPLTYELPKPMVPVLDRPVMAHIVDLLKLHGIEEMIANIHYFPETIKGYFGDQINYSYEEELFGTAGGVRNCAEFLGDSSFLVISGDSLTDIDITSFVKRHKETGGIATLAVKPVTDTTQYGVVLHDSDGRISGFQEKPHPDEALSQLANCGIYMFEPEIFDYFPDQSFIDWANDIFPTLLENDVPFYIHQFDGYWDDIGSLKELREGTFAALQGHVHLALSGQEVERQIWCSDPTVLQGIEAVVAPVWIGQDVKIGSNVRLEGPVVIGDGSVIGDGVALKDTIVFPGTQLSPGSISIGAINAKHGIVESLRSRSMLSSNFN